MTDRTPRIPRDVACHRGLQDALGAFADAAVRNDEIDPVTTELVRVHCATHHDCHT